MPLQAPHPGPISPFIYNAAPGRVVFGQDMFAALRSEIERQGHRRALVLTGREQAARGRSLLADLAGGAVAVLSTATMHTPTVVTEHALKTVRATEADVLVAMGGGSAIGLSKALSLRTGLPQIVIPTTYAGSEMTPILGETEAGMKKTIRDFRVLPQTVIYDVALTATLSPMASVTSGMNAIAHAAEGLYARDANPITTLMALEGIRALVDGLPRVAKDPGDFAARSNALYGAWLCGAVLGAVGMAIHHKLCHTLGGSFDLPHAPTHSVVLPHAISYVAESHPGHLSEIASLFGSAGAGQGIYDFVASLGAPLALKDLGLPYEALDQVAALSVAQPYWNPRPVTAPDVRALLEDAWHGSRPRH